MRIKLIIMLLAVPMLPALSQAQTRGVSVPLMLAPDSVRQGFVRIINGTGSNGSVRITAVDDAGNAASPFSIELPAGASVHFNSDDLADGNSAKGIRGIGQPRQGHWRLRVEAAEGVRVMAFVRTRAGFLTAMHDVLPRDGQGRLVAWMLNPGSNRIQESSLRLVNTGANSERVSIRGTDDRNRSAGPVTLTLPAGQARTISAFDLENGAQGLSGRLGDGGGKWRLTIEAGQAVMGMGLLATPGGPITNISTIGVPPAELDASTEPEAPTRDYYGAFAADDYCGRLRRPLRRGRPWTYGYSIDASTRRAAGDIAVNRCESVSGGYDCCILERFYAGQCLAAALGGEGYHLNYGVASRGQLDELRAGVLNRCWEEGHGDCSIVISACNSGTAGIVPQTQMPLRTAGKHRRQP